MAEIVATVSFLGLTSAGVIQVSPSGVIKAGDRVAGVSNISEHANNGSDAARFGSFAPADDFLTQIVFSDLSAHKYLAIIVR